MPQRTPSILALRMSRRLIPVVCHFASELIAIFGKKIQTETLP